jgi:predicted transcriptional regulator
VSVTALDSLQAQRLLAGHSVSRLAQLANVSDRTIIELEIGGTVRTGSRSRLPMRWVCPS